MKFQNGLCLNVFIALLVVFSFLLLCLLHASQLIYCIDYLLVMAAKLSQYVVN
jgi:hypothetical protein